MRDLRPLIARVEAATGPDREIDALIWLYCFEPTASLDGVKLGEEYYENMLSRSWMECSLGMLWVDQMEPPLQSYTYSLDCAASLLRRKRPQPRMRVEIMPDGKGVASIYDEQDRDGPVSLAATPALALILAFLRAKQSNGSTDDVSAKGAE